MIWVVARVGGHVVVAVAGKLVSETASRRRCARRDERAVAVGVAGVGVVRTVGSCSALRVDECRHVIAAGEAVMVLGMVVLLLLLRRGDQRRGWLQRDGGSCGVVDDEGRRSGRHGRRGPCIGIVNVDAAPLQVLEVAARRVRWQVVVGGRGGGHGGVGP